LKHLCIKTIVLAIGLSLLNPLIAQDKAENMFRNPSPLDTVEWLPKTQPGVRILYASESALQFGDLRLPAGAPPKSGFPVVIFVHGGAWLSDWNKNYSERFVESLAGKGFATWDLEFRRMGNSGGGYPGTFLDIAAGTDHLRILAKSYPLDLGRVVAVGHSSGGHLALWLAGRKNVPTASSLYTINPLPLAGVVSLAGVNDLERSLELGNRKDVLDLLDIESQQAAGNHFAETNPRRLLPFGIPQALIVGTLDAEWRIAMTREYAEAARATGDSVELTIPEGANHFDVVDPEGPAVAMVAEVIRRMAGNSAP